jgi:hypothetical protein
MGFMDKVKGMLGQHGDKADQGVDKAADTADSRTGGKHSDQIRTGADRTKDSLRRTSGDQGTGGGRSSGEGPGGGIDRGPGGDSRSG